MAAQANEGWESQRYGMSILTSSKSQFFFLFIDPCLIPSLTTSKISVI